MYISSIRLKSYYAFRDSGTAIFKPGINIVTGQNSVGKTALLKALELMNSLPNKPHKSTATIPIRSIENLEPSQFWLGITINPEEFRQIFVGQLINFPVDPNFDSNFVSQLISAWLQSKESKEVLCYVHIGSGISAGNEFGLSLYDVPQHPYFGQFLLHPQNGIEFRGSGPSYFQQSFAIEIYKHFTSIPYRFNAERLNVGKSLSGINKTLDPSAQNLPEVLNNLQPEREEFWRYNQLVKAVLPNVGWVSVHPVNNSEVEIRVSPLNPEEVRSDISFSLQECGTGVGQVLAMLYVIQTSYTPKTIIIDEPSSFLHPGAEKALIEVFKQYPQHQYIIGTHSPLIITAAEPSTITKLVLSDDGQESTFEVVDRDKNEELQGVLENLGLSLSDVFGADSILWVEGPTELKCFPLLLRHVRKPLYRTQIAKIWQTSDLEQRNITTLRRIIESYQHISSGGSNSLAPKALGFFVDREDQSDTDIDEIRRISQGKVEVTKYRHYENYLLHSHAIAEVLKISDTSGRTQVATEEIEIWKNKQINDDKYKAKKLPNTLPFHGRIDAAKFLRDLFSHFSDGRVSYQKTTHSVQLTKWLLENDPNHLKPLIEELTTFIEQCKVKL